jgi:hypothetical protein
MQRFRLSAPMQLAVSCEAGIGSVDGVNREG